MQVLINAETNKEVKVGDVVVVKNLLFEKDDRKNYFVSYITITEENVPELIHRGALIQKVHRPTLFNILYNIHKKFSKYLPNSYATVLQVVESIYPASAFNILLKEVAIELDKNYGDHISNSPKIFTISALNGHIVEVDKRHIKNYKNFAAFRTIEDAQYALNILDLYFKELFS